MPLHCLSQTQQPSSRDQFWPGVSLNFELSPRARLTATAEKHNGEDAFFKQEKFGVVVGFRMRRIAKLLGEVDKDNHYNLTIGGGYEFLKTDDNGTNKAEHRVLAQSTPKYVFGPKILAQDRNQIEFRWIDGVYNFRYRNRLTVERAFKVGKFKFSPYASGELFWDRNRKSWNQNQYAFGVRLPYRKILSTDVYWMKQNCTTCSSPALKILGIKANFFFDWPGRVR